MPSLLHEGLLDLIRERPEFVAQLLRDLLRLDVPHFTEARLADPVLNEPIPTEYCADAVILFRRRSSGVRVHRRSAAE